MSKYIPLSIPNFEGNESKYVNQALEQGWVSTGGEFINQFEKNLSAYLNAPEVAACQSGTSAIHLSLIEGNINQNDVVLVSPLTFIAAVNPIIYQKAIPVFIDCDDSLCIDPDKIETFIREKCTIQDSKLYFNENRVKAIIVVHVFGNLADMKRIMEIAELYNLVVIEDATEALGSYYNSGALSGKFAGTVGNYGAYSFNGNKIITTGGGGAVTANDADKVKHMRFLSTQAKKDPHFYIHDEIGYNYRMTNLQAALGVAQLEELEEFIQRKNRFFERYSENFKDFEFASILPFRTDTRSNKWFVSLVIDIDSLNTTIKEIIEELDKAGIGSRAIWGLICDQKPYLDCFRYNLEKADYYYKRIINLPSSTSLTLDEVDYISEKVKEIIKGHIK